MITTKISIKNKSIKFLVRKKSRGEDSDYYEFTIETIGKS